MNCPNCNKQLEVMWEEPTGEIIHPDGSKTIEVVGHCSNCKLYDGRWNIDISPSGEITERNLEKFFFG